MTLVDILEIEDCVYLACVMKDGTIIKAEIQPSDYWVGGNEGGFTDDSNIYFETPQQAENYYNRKYAQVFAFEEDYEADDKCDELEQSNA